jgi:O-succinylbenzoate synthase
VPARLRCLRNAIAAAREEIAAAIGAAEEKSPDASPTALGVAALLSAGRAALEQIPPKAEVGFRVFKWKVGVGDLSDELALLDDVCAALPSGGKLRLDANGAWDRRKAERWLERCADRPVEFVEQPCFARAEDGATAQRRVEDTLLGLASDFPTPIGLDESLVGDADLARWMAAGWPGVYVIKPSMFGDRSAALWRLEHARADVVFSSALETAVGAKAGLKAAFAWSERMQRPVGAVSGAPGSNVARNTDAPPRRAVGFGVWPLFADARFDGPASAPFLRFEDVAKIEASHLWNALS